jgi:hypothetical protein
LTFELLGGWWIRAWRGLVSNECARAALLTSDMRAINRALERNSGMYIDTLHHVVVLGRRATIVVVQKR